MAHMDNTSWRLVILQKYIYSSTAMKMETFNLLVYFILQAIYFAVQMTS